MRYRIKIVPKTEPNSDGEWIEVEAEEMPKTTKWIETDRWFKPHVPDTYFLVQVEREIGS
jgi:hypothetical protein